MNVGPTADDFNLKKFVDSIQDLPQEEQLERILGVISLVQPLALLQDLLDRGVRNASLFNAATALLKYHRIEINPLAAARPTHPVGALLHGMPPADFLQGNEHGIQ